MLERLGEQLQNLSLTAKAVVVLILFLGAGYLSYSENVELAQSALQTAQDAEAKLTSDITNFNKSGQSLSSIEAQKRKAQEEFSDLFAMLPQEVEIEGLLAQFADAARDSGANMTKFTPDGSRTPTLAAAPVGQAGAQSGPSAPDFVSRSGFSVTIEGTFVQIVTFLDRVLSLKRVVRAESFELAPTTGTQQVNIPGMAAGNAVTTNTTSDGSPVLSTTIKFSAFTQKGRTNLTTALASPPKARAPKTENSSGMSAKPLPEGGKESE
jgi:Tfp pilus assembly protein PilO